MYADPRDERHPGPFGSNQWQQGDEDVYFQSCFLFFFIYTEFIAGHTALPNIQFIDNLPTTFKAPSFYLNYKLKLFFSIIVNYNFVFTYIKIL